MAQTSGGRSIQAAQAATPASHMKKNHTDLLFIERNHFKIYYLNKQCKYHIVSG